MVSNNLPLRTTGNPFVSALLALVNILIGIVMFFVPNFLRTKKSVKNQNILITGGGSGIGQLMAIKFSQLGGNVIIWDISTDGMTKTVRMIKEAGCDVSKVKTYAVNLSKKDDIYATAQRTIEENGFIDVLINNAGVVSGAPFLDIPDQKIQLTFDVNTMAHFWILKKFLPEMVKRNQGHIVTVASVAGNMAGCNMSDYHASKFANVGFDLSLRMEIAQADKTGIKTSIVKPYFITTGMFAGVNPGLIPYLSPDYVCEKIVEGILVEQEEIVIPYWLVFVFTMASMVPSRALAPMLDLIGGFEHMSHFEGRDAQAAKANKSKTMLDTNKNEVNNNDTQIRSKNDLNNNTDKKIN